MQFKFVLLWTDAALWGDAALWSDGTTVPD